MMTRPLRKLFPLVTLPVLFISAASANPHQGPADDPLSPAQAELHGAVKSLANDIMTANIEGLQAAHLVSTKFSKFGPRKFERQDLSEANASEAAFFGSISNVDYRVNDLKIDVFGDIGIVTYYPRVSFVKEGEPNTVDGRQTLVFLKTNEGWKIVHEHGTARP